MICLLLWGSISFTACNSDNLNTDQYGNAIALNSFGPCPVLRGGVLHFLGSNLDQITSITIPGCDPITNITVVTSGDHSEITVEVPKENCTEGYVTLTTPKGGTITTGTKITYSEPIVFSKFYVGSEGTLAGNVGNVVTIEGDYLNLMHAVIFTDGVKVPESQFATHTRYKIEVAIPKHAKTGKILLSDENSSGANYLYSDKELTVNLPTCTSMTPTKVKSGATMTFKGTSLGLIQYVSFTGAEVDSTALTINTAGTELTCALPAKATDGEVNLVTYSGIKIPAGTIETIVPTSLAAAPSPIKNGATITITGKDLDLATGISFPNASGTIASQTATAITAIVPETAQEGDITLSLANGKTVTTAYKLIKPAVTSIAPATVIAGNEITLTGTDLDLVAAITFPGEGNLKVSSFATQSETSIKATVPVASVGTGCILNLKNGTTISVTGLTVNAATDPAISDAPAISSPGKTITITGKNFNNAENFYIGTTKITKYSNKGDTSVTFTIPDNCKTGDQTITIEGYDGKTYQGPKISILIDIAPICVMQSDQSKTVVFPLTLTWDDTGRFRVQRNSTPSLASLGLTAGTSKLIIFKTATETGQAQINNGNWGAFDTVADWNGNTEKLELTFTQSMVDWCNGTSTDGWSNTAFIIQGGSFAIKGIYILP